MRAAPQPAHFSGLGRLAVKLLCFGAAAGASGCLLPQDDQVLPRIPSSQNLPPIILDTQRKPIQTPTTVSIGPTCTPEFQVLVKDDSATIQHKWFVDPESDYIPPADGTNAGYQGESQSGTAETIRVIKAPSAFFAYLKNQTGGKHRVDVVVTDGNLSDKPNGALDFTSSATGFDELGNPTALTPYHVIFTWIVSLQPCP